MAVEMASAEGAAPRESEVQISIKFTTKLPAELRVPETPVTVPGNLTRYGLSQIINHLLALDPARPFDFLIRDTLLRLSLHQHLSAHALSAETVLEVEYVPAVLPPTPKEQHPHDDWISALAVLSLPKHTSLLAAGCYDGVVRLWKDDASASAGTFAAHKGPVKAAVGVGGAAASQLLTAGDDCVGRVWRWPAGASAPPELLAVLKGHTAAVTGAAASPGGDRCATSGWDGQTLMWRGGEALAAAVEAAAEEGDADTQKRKSKKRRTGLTAGASVPTGAHEEEPLGALSGHGQCVAAVTWPTDDVIITGSWDHEVRVWDPEVLTVVDSFAHNKAVHCVTAGPGGGAAVVAFGGPEKTLRVWDRRQQSGENLAVAGLASHSDWITALTWHPESEHHLLSVSHDRTAKLWDLRAAVPLHTLDAAGDKLLSCCWVGGGVATGGADCVLRTAVVEL